MDRTDSLFPDKFPIVLLTADNEERHHDVTVVATRDHELIQRWASRHQCQPATGEATASGSASTSINDGGAGIRFNFPAASRFRPISWEEWFGNFEEHELVFIYERDRPGTTPSYRYRLTKLEELTNRPTLI